MLDEIELSLAPDRSAASLKAEVAALLGWPPVDELARLEGHVEPWELLAHAGSELADDALLGNVGSFARARAGRGGGDGPLELVLVRKVLVAEGWKLVSASGEGDSDDSSTDEDDF